MVLTTTITEKIDHVVNLDLKQVLINRDSLNIYFEIMCCPFTRYTYILARFRLLFFVVVAFLN